MSLNARPRVMLVGIGESNNIGSFFREALKEAQLEHVFIDEWKYLQLSTNSLWQRIVYKTVRRPMGYKNFNRHLVTTFDEFRPSVVIVTKGPFVGIDSLARMRSAGTALLVNYATDDPFNPANQTADLVGGIPYYHLYVCPRRSILGDVQKAGCMYTAYVPFAYHPRLHFPARGLDDSTGHEFSCDVVFIGNADQDRVPFFEPLANCKDINLHLHGAGWEQRRAFAKARRGFVFDHEFRQALGGAKIAVCLVRRANRDDNVMRTFETPACGAFMLAERTSAHVSLFREGEHVACFGSPEELLAKVRYYLAEDRERLRLAKQGYTHVVSGHNTYADRLLKILRLVNELR